MTPLTPGPWQTMTYKDHIQLIGTGHVNNQYDIAHCYGPDREANARAIAKVPAILHTPLMSGSNFVHGIVVVGAMVALGHAETTAGQIIGFIGVVLGAGNAVGGYVVTERMLEMFKSSGDKN